MKPRPPDTLKVGWDSAVLVCRQCRKRSNGPVHLKTREVAQALRHALKDAKPRPRIVLTTCLGPCPKRAISVAIAARGKPVRVMAVQTLADAESAASSSGI